MRLLRWIPTSTAVGHHPILMSRYLQQRGFAITGVRRQHAIAARFAIAIAISGFSNHSFPFSSRQGASTTPRKSKESAGKKQEHHPHVVHFATPVPHVVAREPSTSILYHSFYLIFGRRARASQYCDYSRSTHTKRY